MPLKTMKKYISIPAFAAVLFLQGISAHAQDGTMVPPAKGLQNDVIPVVSAEESDHNIDLNASTHPPLRLTPDKSEIIRLDKKAGSIIIGNPNHVNFLPDSATRLIAVPRAPGASFITILDENGDVLMQRHVIVGSPKEKYVRIRRTCTDDDCQPTSVYFCPDMCHEIMMSSESEGSTASAEDLAAATGEVSDATAGDADENIELP